VVAASSRVGPPREELGQVGFYCKAGQDRVQGRIGFDLGRVHIQFLAPDQASLLALLDNGVEEAAEDGDTVAVTNTARLEWSGSGSCRS
jgi:hypothetical protein